MKCNASKQCGGCKFINMPYKDTLDIKQAYIDDLLGGFVTPERIIGMKNPYFYRNKVHHVFAYDKKTGIFSGCYQENTHRVVSIDRCLIEDEKSQEIIKTVCALCKSFKIKAYDEDTGFGLLRHILIRRGFTSGEIMVILVMSSTFFPGKNNFVKALRDAHPEITTVVQNINNAHTSMVLGDSENILFGPGFIKDSLCGCVFRISPKSFYQVNPAQTEVLYRTAVDYACLSGKELVIDAYCGIGTIGICAASGAKNVIGVEQNPDAVRDARINAKENHLSNVSFFCDDASKWISCYNGHADVVFMDPPRSGSTPAFIRSVAKLSPDRVVYVSCGPDTLSRDLKIFTGYGYRVKKIQPVDMFPFAGHVETVVLMSRVNR